MAERALDVVTGPRAAHPGDTVPVVLLSNSESGQMLYSGRQRELPIGGQQVQPRIVAFRAQGVQHLLHRGRVARLHDHARVDRSSVQGHPEPVGRVVFPDHDHLLDRRVVTGLNDTHTYLAGDLQLHGFLHPWRVAAETLHIGHGKTFLQCDLHRGHSGLAALLQRRLEHAARKQLGQKPRKATPPDE